jgi:3-isopropylmalate dehydrogenase
LCRYSLDDEAGASAIESAVAAAIEDGARTRDTAREGQAFLGTEAFTDRVLAHLPSLQPAGKLTLASLG